MMANIANPMLPKSQYMDNIGLNVCPNTSEAVGAYSFQTFPNVGHLFVSYQPVNHTNNPMLSISLCLDKLGKDRAEIEQESEGGSVNASTTVFRSVCGLFMYVLAGLNAIVSAINRTESYIYQHLYRFSISCIIFCNILTAVKILSQRQFAPLLCTFLVV
jgi:hypothetical protein